MKNQKKLLRNNLSEEQFFTLPGIYDPLGAKIAEINGFSAVYLSGGAMSMAALGKPDMGFLNMSDLRTNLERIMDATELAVIADTDNGFGNAAHTANTAGILDKMGVCGMQLDDNISPAMVPGNAKELIDWNHLSPKIKAVRDRVDDDFIIILRTIIGKTEGMAAALDRAEAAVELGVDYVFIDGISNIDEFTYVTENSKVKLLVNLNESTFAATLPVEQVIKAGFKIGLYPVSTLQLSAGIYQEVFNLLKNEKSTMKMKDRMILAPELQNIFGKNELIEKYEKLY